jgi:hypothetical protein
MHMRAFSRKKDPAWKTITKGGRLYESRTAKCAEAVTCDLMTSRWDEVTCEKCLTTRRWWGKEDRRIGSYGTQALGGVCEEK